MLFRTVDFLDGVGKCQAYKNVVSNHRANLKDKQFLHKYGVGGSLWEHNLEKWKTIRDKMMNFPFLQFIDLLKEIYWALSTFKALDICNLNKI